MNRIRKYSVVILIVFVPQYNEKGRKNCRVLKYQLDKTKILPKLQNTFFYLSAFCHIFQALQPIFSRYIIREDIFMLKIRIWTTTKNGEKELISEKRKSGT